jgi:glucose-1-phosphate adenylyltransferase
MVEHKERVHAYPFAGYWQDVGTIHSYWEAHMKLLDDHPSFDLYDPSWVIHTRSEERPPAHVHNGAHSVLSPGVVVEEGAVVRNSILLFDTVVGAGSVIDHTITDKEVVIGKQCQIGYGEVAKGEMAFAVHCIMLEEREG